MGWRFTLPQRPGAGAGDGSGDGLHPGDGTAAMAAAVPRLFRWGPRRGAAGSDRSGGRGHERRHGGRTHPGHRRPPRHRRRPRRRSGLRELAAAAGPVDVLVTNVARACTVDAGELTVAEWQDTFAVNVTAPMLPAQALGPGMAERVGDDRSGAGGRRRPGLPLRAGVRAATPRRFGRAGRTPRRENGGTRHGPEE